MRFVSSVTVALTVAFTAAMNAQEVKSTTKITGDNVKPVNFTGCLQTGTQSSSYVLDKVVPVGQTTKTEATGTAGEITKTTTTTYALVPGERVEFQKMVGHKVEVTGVLLFRRHEDGNEDEDRARRREGRQVKDKTKTDNALRSCASRRSSTSQTAARCKSRSTRHPGQFLPALWVRATNDDHLFSACFAGSAPSALTRSDGARETARRVFPRTNARPERPPARSDRWLETRRRSRAPA